MIQTQITSMINPIGYVACIPSRYAREFLPVVVNGYERETVGGAIFSLLQNLMTVAEYCPCGEEFTNS